MFNKLKTKFNKEVNDTLSYVSEGSVKLIMQREIYQKSNKHTEEINTYFDYFFNNYLKVLEYLKNDFGVKNITQKDKDGKKDTEDIDLQITTLIKIMKFFNKGLFKNRSMFRNKINPYMFYNKVDKWKKLNDVMFYYPQLLKLLKSKCDNNIYKEIDINEELELLKECEYLEEDFDFIIKKINQDKDKNG